MVKTLIDPPTAVVREFGKRKKLGFTEEGV